MRSLPRIYRTVRHLRLQQAIGQLVCRCRRYTERPQNLLNASAPPLILSEATGIPELTPPVPLQESSRIVDGKLSFLNQTCAVGFPPDWSLEELPSRLWQYNLHYFDWLWSLIGTDDEYWSDGKRAVQSWIGKHPPARQAVGWEPYPTSLRLINWTLLFFVVHRERTLQDPAFARSLWESIWRQTEWLSRRLETHIQANHLLENVAALAVQGSVFQGSCAQSWLHVAQSHLSKEIAEQIPGDGLHYERSPMYHLRVLWLMDTLSKVGKGPVRGAALTCLPRMTEALAHTLHPDGRIALLNDSAESVYALPKTLKEPVHGAFALPDAGYYGFRNTAGDYVILDVGAVGPDHQPGHAHADFFNFELSLKGKRVIVDTGVNDYTNSATRRHARSTGAHNTLEVNGQNSCEVWSVFRVGRRVKPRLISWTSKASGFLLEAEHDGYYHMPSKTVHSRRFEWSGGELRICDCVLGTKPVLAVGRLHLAPGIVVELEGNHARCKFEDVEFQVKVDGPGSLQLSESDYYPRFGMVCRRPMLEYRVDHIPDPKWITTISW